MSDQALIVADHIRFGYGGRAVVRADHLRLLRGRCLGVFGPNGSGKTTLVRGLTGLLPPISGQIQRPRGLRLGYVAQHRAMPLHWPMSGMDAAALAVSARRWLGWVGRGATRTRLRDAMKRLEVAPLASAPFATLSGGQQQRLILAGAVAAEPDVLVLDEPTEGLDVRSRRILIDVLREVMQGGAGLVLISHDVRDLSVLASDVAWLHEPDEADAPSLVETITPDLLADRVAHGGVMS